MAGLDDWFTEAERWRDEFAALRRLALGCGLDEAMKWGQPCYSHGGRNIVLMHGFKDYCALLFFKGALMDDPDSLLIQQTKNVQAGRQVRFTAVGEIARLEPKLKSYIENAIAVETAGLEVPMKATVEFETPPEFQQRLDAEPDLRAAFQALTPGRQRGYLLHFAAAKQAKTREARIDKHRARILEGKGLDD